MANVWDTAPSLELLKTLWAKGLSSSQIAAWISNATKQDISRNAVIGKIHRLGLSGRVKADPDRSKNDKRAIANRRIAARLKAEARQHLEIVHSRLPDIEDKARKALQDLGDDDRRYIPFEPTGVCFCALPKHPGSSYCLKHMLRTSESVTVRSSSKPDASAPAREMAEAI